MERRGFSLLEIIVVLALLSIILGIFLVRMRGLDEQRRIETAKGDLRALQTAVHAYYLNHPPPRAYPPEPAGNVNWQNSLVADNPRVLRQVLYDPFRVGPANYSYHRSPNGTYYVIAASGPDGEFGINGIDNDGAVTGPLRDDIFASNGITRGGIGSGSSSTTSTGPLGEGRR